MIGETVSHYKILEKLGGGGMGVVYKAEDTKLKRTVALKFLSPELTRDPEAKERFVREAQAASALDHPHIGTIHEISETEDGQLFIAMACYAGESLKDRIERGPLPIEEAIDIAIQIAQGLSKAHEKEIVHRDMKPANVVITEDAQLKIIDFGLAKLMGSTVLTKTGTTMGTVAYMSPEQAQGAEVDYHTDVWALGVMLYEMLAGKNPFMGDYEQAVLYSILNEAPEFITKVRGEVPVQIEKILEKALDKDPEKRFQTMEEMLEDLQNAVEELKEGGRRKLPVFRLGRKQRKYAYRAFVVVLLAIAFGFYLWWSQVAEATPVSIALLPLESITNDAEQEWFTDGMTDALITGLAKISGLRVITRSSAMRYKGTEKAVSEIAAELGVEFVIEGSVVKLEDQVKVSTRLINASTDDYIWAEDYEREFSNILGLQGEIAQTIASQIQVKLTPQEEARIASARQVNPEAYEAYLKGQFHWYKLSRQDLDTALRYFELALEKDPNYALAHAGIALVWGGRMQQGFMPHSEAGPKVKAAAAKALELDSTLVEVHHTLAVVRTWYEWDWEGAETAFRQAIALNPNYPDSRAYFSHFLNFIGRPEEAIVQIERAVELDPLNSLFQALYGMDLLYVHRYDDAIAQLRNTLKIAPNDPVVRSTLRTAFHMKGMYEEALEEWKAFYATRGDREAEETLARGYLEDGYLRAMLGLAEMMEKRSRTAYVTPWQIGTLYTRAGKNDKALDWLEKAFETHDANVPYLSVDPLFDNLRSDPRFQDLLRSMGLAEKKL
jgi:TolB-like protein/tRNA A-37 threonylcarbamoyl transferase component Bud32